MNTDWNDLIQRHIDGFTTDEEAQRLAAALKADDALTDLYVRHIGLEVALEANAASAEVTRELLTAPAQATIRPRAWFSWRPLTAAAAGIVFGMLCTSVVYGFVAPHMGAVKKMPLPVFDPGLEGMKPLDKVLPHGVDEWGVRSARIVSAENGVEPLHGQRMLRMEPILLGEQDEKHYSHAYQVLDLRSLPLDVVSGAVEMQVTASFCASENGGKARYLIRAVALNEPPGTAPSAFWSKAEDAGVASLSQRFETEAGDSGWHTFSVKMPLPHSAQSLVIILSAISPKDETSEAAERYLDEVQVSLLSSPRIQP